MEQRGRNHWQTFGSPAGRKWLDLGRTAASGCHRLPFGSYGKERVDGSSPEEGLKGQRAQDLVLRVPGASTFRVHGERRKVAVTAVDHPPLDEVAARVAPTG